MPYKWQQFLYEIRLDNTIITLRLNFSVDMLFRIPVILLKDIFINNRQIKYEFLANSSLYETLQISVESILFPLFITFDFPKHLHNGLIETNAYTLSLATPKTFQRKSHVKIDVYNTAQHT